MPADEPGGLLAHCCRWVCEQRQQPANVDRGAQWLAARDDDLLLQAITEDVDAIPLPVSPTPPSQESVLPAV